ncbi:MAG: type VI secretion system tip protein TssI/VgrG [Polyangiaceae bacterium]
MDNPPSDPITLHGDGLPGDLRVHAYRAHEAISLPYSVEVELSTADAGFRVEELLAQRLVLQVTDALGNVRHFDGLPDEAGFLACQGDELFFHLRLRPAIAVLAHREGSRIFQDKSPVEVIKEVLAEAGVDRDVEWRISQEYAPREFLCQYRETELDFVHRLLEEEGIFYFFHHSADGHKLIFADDPAAFAEQEAIPKVTLSPRPRAAPGASPLLGFVREKRLRPTEVSLRDHDFEKPDVPPASAIPAPAPGGVALRYFDYPGGFTKGKEGARRARARVSALRSDMDVCTGKSRAIGLACGVPMVVDGANEAFLNAEYIVTELRSVGRRGGEACENELVAIPKGAPFAAPRRAKKPVIEGIQTAIVTGPSNEPEAIHTDKYGRIKARFLWDRSGKQDDTSSVWLRVSQLGLGGSMVLPRVGWEVAVAFLEGDPDRPVVLGRVYNPEQAPPYAQPGAAADGSLKTRSTPGGGGINEIKMSDTAGSQGFSISAQKDMNVTTGNDKNETVAVDETHSVGSNYAVSIGSNETVKVGANQSINVGNAFQIQVGGAQDITVGGDEQTHAKADFVENVGGAGDYQIGGNRITISCGVRQQITGAFTRDVGAVQANVSLASVDDAIMGTLDASAGAAVLHVAKGAAVESVAGDKNATSLAAELHIAPDFTTQAAVVDQLIGGVHLRNVGGDFVMKAPQIVLAGGVGKLTGGGSSFNLNGGPVTASGSKIALEAAMIVKLASDLKIG